MRTALPRAGRTGLATARFFAIRIRSGVPRVQIHRRGPKEAELFLKNLPKDATAADVHAHCAKVCDVRSVAVPEEGGISRGVAYVTFRDKDADAVRQALDGSTMLDREIEVGLTKPSKASPADKAAAADSAPAVYPPGTTLSNVFLNKAVMRCASAYDVLHLFQKRCDEFTAVNLATALHRIGLVDRSFAVNLEPLLRALVERAVASMQSDSNHWEPKHLVSVVWGLARLEHVESRQEHVKSPVLFKAVETDAIWKMADFEPQHLVNIAWAFSHAGFEAPSLFQAVALEAPKKIQIFHPHDLTNIISAYTKAGVPAPTLYEAVAVEAAKKAEDMTEHSLAKLVWSYAQAGVEAPALFEAVTAQVRRRIAKCNPQNLASIAWAYSLAGAEAPELFEAVAAEARRTIATFNPLDLSNLVWAFANKGVDSPDLFDAVAGAGAAPSKIKLFRAQELAHLVWAFATAKVEAPGLFHVVAAEASVDLSHFHAQALATTVWAFATAGVDEVPLFRAVAAEAPRKMEAFTAQELANIVWAFSTASAATPALHEPQLYDAVSEQALGKIGQFKPKELADLVWAYAKAGVLAPELFEAVAPEAVKKIAAFNLQDLANTAWAFARAGVPAPALFEAVSAEAVRNMPRFKSKDIANLAWAFSVAGIAAPFLFEAIASEIKPKPEEYFLFRKFSNDGLAQLHQVAAFLRLELPKNALAKVLTLVKVDLKFAHLRDVPPTQSMRDVAKALRRIGWDHDFAHVTAQGVLVDFAQPAEMVALEFDGPTRYLSGSEKGEATRVLDGTARLKERMLGRMGWKLFRVPYFEWDTLLSSAEQEDYLRAMVRGSEPSPPSD